MSSSNKKYDVFISFRGEDTRTNFTSHLHSALDRANIRTHIDNDLEKGDDVWPALSQAIHDSHLAIVVFSENYASSKWCLEELIKILQCRKDQRHRQVVIPVFYEVDPSHIRKQTGSYGIALAKYEQGFHGKNNESIKKKVSKWKVALTEAANISGWDTGSHDYKNDSQVIEKIVKDVLEKLDLRYPNEQGVEGFVGIDKICKDIELLLSKTKKKLLLKNVQAIGIWGMGGIGKTTIAKVVFSQLFSQYDSVCFLANVREESKRLGLISLHDKLLSELLKVENPKSNLVGSTFITRSFSRKKVFIVLDDVDSLDQLDELCRECRSAAPDSKLIITTRNRHLLRGRADEIYEVKTWSFDKSLELFSLHAFKQRRPKRGYKDLSRRAIDYAGGVPLALKVLGSNLYARNTEFWDIELRKLMSYPSDEIQNVLQVSYDGLDSLQKKIFLDIAFFFKGEYKDYVLRILNACGFHAIGGIKVLEDKALITISNSKRIQMHDLLQEMGLKIVRQDIENPGKRSRLRNIEEVSDVLENKKGSDAIEGIKLDLSEIDDLHLNADAFSMMTNLRFLILHIPSGKRSGNVDYPRVLNKFPAKLRYLEWNGYRLKSLPAAFCAKMLVEIRMPHSHLIELWWGVQDVTNLEGIDLSECKQLKNLPDLSKASKLKWVNLSGCESLCDVHPSILSLDTLETLILDSCKKLKSLESEKHLKSLKNINVHGCTSLKIFSVSSDLMGSLDLSNTGIEKLHSSIGRLRRLWSLNLEGLILKNLPNELSFLKNLEELKISNCRLVLDKHKLHILFDGLTHLICLHLKDCCISELPDNISGLACLHKLRLDGSSMKTLPGSIKHLSGLEILSLKNCKKLRCIPELPPNIKKFNAVNCRSLVTIFTLKTIAANMRGKGKFISFENCIRLDGHSLHCIMEGAQLTMMSAVFQNVQIGLDNEFYKSAKVCLPGSRVPGQFTNRTTESSVAMSLSSDSNLLGIILSVVLSPSPGLKKHGAKIYCQCYSADGTKVGHATTWYHRAITELNSDHVFLWYDAFQSDSIVRSLERQVSFEFYLTDDVGERDVLSFDIKECGVRLIFDSELHCLLRELDLDLESKWQLLLDLGEKLGLELRSELRLELESQHRETLTTIERSHENESKQEQDLSEKCSCSRDCLVLSLIPMYIMLILLLFFPTLIGYMTNPHFGN